jgi:hypothetical protein
MRGYRSSRPYALRGIHLSGLTRSPFRALTSCSVISRFLWLSNVCECLAIDIEFLYRVVFAAGVAIAVLAGMVAAPDAR